MKKRISSILIIGAIICFLAALIVPNLTSKKAGTQRVEPAAATVEEPPFTKHGTLTFWVGTSDSARATVDIEIVEDDFHRSRGLMYRRSMEEKQAMLFIFQEVKPLSFWMKNTYIPLDLTYLDAAQKVVRIHRNTTPLQEKNYLSEVPAQYCVETNAWFTHTYGIMNGDSISWERIAPS